MEDTIVNILALIVIVLPFFSIWAAYRLWSIARHHKNVIALKERAQSAMILALVSILSAIIAINRLWTASHDGDPLLHSPWLAITAAAILILTSVPNILWALWYRKNHFDNGRS